MSGGSTVKLKCLMGLLLIVIPALCRNPKEFTIKNIPIIPSSGYFHFEGGWGMYNKNSM